MRSYLWAAVQMTPDTAWEFSLHFPGGKTAMYQQRSQITAENQAEYKCRLRDQYTHFHALYFIHT